MIIDMTPLLDRIEALIHTVDVTSSEAEKAHAVLKDIAQVSVCSVLQQAIGKADDHAFFEYRWQVVFAKIFEAIGVSARDGVEIISKLGEKVDR